MIIVAVLALLLVWIVGNWAYCKGKAEGVSVGVRYCRNVRAEYLLKEMTPDELELILSRCPEIEYLVLRNGATVHNPEWLDKVWQE